MMLVYEGGEPVEVVGWGLVLPGHPIEFDDGLARELLSRPRWREDRRPTPSADSEEVI